MATLLAPSDFDNPTCIIAKRGNYDIRQSYIDKFEPIFLKAVLGLRLYNLLIAEYAKQPQARDAKFVDLWVGKQYEVDGILYEYLGAKIATQFYIKSEFLYGEYRHQTGIGEVKLKSDKSEILSPWGAITDAYNECATIAGNPSKLDYSTIYTFITTNIADYQEFEESQFRGFGLKNILAL